MNSLYYPNTVLTATNLEALAVGLFSSLSL